jgi:acetyl-CoA carboxylase alpha subunit
MRDDLSRVVDEVVAEPVEGAKPNAVATAAVKEAVERHLGEVEALSQNQRFHQRTLRFRRLGAFAEWEQVEVA